MFKEKEIADGRRCARGPDGGDQREDSAAAVRRADQGQAEQRYQRVHDPVRQRETGRVLRQERVGGPQDRHQGDRGIAGAGSGAQGPRSDPAQGRAGIGRDAAQAGGLPGARPGAVRIIPGGGRIGRRHRQAGPRPPLPGDSAAQGQDPERGEGALRQDAEPRGNPRHDHGVGDGHRQGRFRRQPSCATARSSS